MAFDEGLLIFGQFRSLREYVEEVPADIVECSQRSVLF